MLEAVLRYQRMNILRIVLPLRGLLQGWRAMRFEKKICHDKNKTQWNRNPKRRYWKELPISPMFVVIQGQVLACRLEKTTKANTRSRIHLGEIFDQLDQPILSMSSQGSRRTCDWNELQQLFPSVATGRCAEGVPMGRMGIRGRLRH